MCAACAISSAGPSGRLERSLGIGAVPYSGEGCRRRIEGPPLRGQEADLARWV